MKKLFSVCAVVLLLFLLLPSAANAQYSTSRFGFKVYGGLNYLSGGDFNKGAVGYGETWIDWLNLLGATTDGEFAPVHWGMNFGGEFIYQFTPNIGVGLGVEYISATKSSEITYTPSLPPEFKWKSSPSAIPIKLSLYYFLPSSGNMKIFFNAGVGYYLAKANFDHDFWIALLFPPARWVAETSGGGLGFHGGLGFEYNFTPMVGIVAEVRGRYASFSNFEGDVDWTFPYGGGTAATVDGKLWATDFPIAGLGTYTWLWIDTIEPAGTNVHEASVDFSGFSFLIGLVLHF